MSDIEKLKDLIPGYLTKSLNDEQTRSFEKGLEEYDELQEELEQIAFIAHGLDVSEHIQGIHPSSEMLVRFSQGFSVDEQEDQDEIAFHIESCSSCQELITLTKQSLTSEVLAPKTSSIHLTQKLFNLFFGTGRMLRPIPAVFSLLLVAFTGYWMAGTSPSGEIQEFEIFEFANRGSSGENIVTIDSKSAIVHLNFKVPVSNQFMYDFQLSDTSGAIKFATNDNLPKTNMSMTIPSDLLTESTYTLRVIEKSSSGEALDDYAFEIQIKRE